jgi:competence ComEA-like helix-hairpin-helix protein
MTPYSRRQLLVLLILLAIAGLGLAVGHWRRAHPDLAGRLEQLDRAEAPPPTVPELDSRGATPVRATDEPVPRRARRRAPTRDTGGDERAPAQGAVTQVTPARHVATASALDLNRSTAVELTRLPGIGPVLARRIVDARETDGPFASVDELRRVPGVSARRLEQLRAMVTISD